MSGRRTFRPSGRRIGASVRLWALGISAGVHLLGLGLLGAFHFSRRDAASAGLPADISIHMIERVLEAPAPKPKPVFEPAAAPPVQTPAPVALPPVPAAADLPVVLPPAPVAPAAARAPEPSLFFGAETAANRICYVVDGSGSMFGLMYLVREQLRESILRLSPDQSFNVVFFMRDGRLLEAFEGRLAAASPSGKTEALNLLGRVRPEGQTSAEQGLEAAMRMRDRLGRRPEVIFFLTDGFDLMEGGGSDFIGRFENLRKTLAPGVIVHTIGIYPAREDSVILSELARSCGGRYIEMK